MRKRVYGKQLSRNRKSRKALYRSLVRSLILSGKIKTTSAKAKSIEKEISKLKSLSTNGSLSARRQALKMLGNDNEVVNKLFTEKFIHVKKNSLLPRKGDNAPMAELKLIKNEKNISS